MGATTQALHVERGDGRRERVVLRVYLPGRDSLTPERAQREFRTIELVQAAGIPSSRPLFLDAAGEYLGRPAMLLSYLPGRSLYAPRNFGGWTAQLAEAMRAIHEVTPERFDLSWLPRMGREEVASEVSDLTDPIGFIDDVLAHRALEALETGAARLEWLPDCLVHEDFWPGNTVWSRNELVGVIDWANAKVGDPRFDLAQCRVDVLIANGMKVSDALVEACGRLNPRITHDLWFFDLLLGLRALTQFRTWLLGYHDAGLDHLTEELAEGRIRELLSRSLVAASAASRP